MGHTEKEVVDSIIAFIKRDVDEIKEIQFFGGEPLLGYKAIIYFLDEFDKLKLDLPYFKMVSNFTNLPDEFIPYIIKYDIRITVSLDGPREINDLLRVYQNNKESSFDQVCTNISKLRSMGGDIAAIECTYTALHKKMKITHDQLKKYFYNQFSLKNIMISDARKIGNNNESFAVDSQCDTLFSNLEMLEVDELVYINAAFNKKCRKLSPFCQAGYSMISIFPNGDIYPCYLFSLYDNQCYGNIKNDWLGGEFMKKARDELKKIINKKSLDCNKCSARNVCRICTSQILINKEEMNEICSENIDLNIRYLDKLVKNGFSHKHVIKMYQELKKD